MNHNYTQLYITRVYLTFTTGGTIHEIVGHIDPLTVHVHMYTLEKNRQNDCKRGLFSPPTSFLVIPAS